LLVWYVHCRFAWLNSNNDFIGIQLLQAIGNTAANSIFEAQLQLKHGFKPKKSTSTERSEYIVDKYNKRRFINSAVLSEFNSPAALLSASPKPLLPKLLAYFASTDYAEAGLYRLYCLIVETTADSLSL
jgi:hypothetical protein